MHAAATPKVRPAAGPERGAAAATGLRIAFAGGGTGGHVVPGLHLLAHARKAGLVVDDLVWFTSGRPVEDRVFAGAAGLLADLPFERVRLALEPAGGGAPSRARLAVRTPRAVLDARATLRAHQSQVLLGLGGFTSLPAVVAARGLRIPVVLLEVNAASGLATRWLAPLAARTLHSWTASVRPRAARHARVGPPLSPEIATAGAATPADRRAARAALGFDPDRPLLVVLGGSQGAGALNGFVRAHLARLAGAGLQVLHQTGPGRLNEAAPAVSGYRALEFVEPVRTALLAATAVLCRGGASTLAEIAALRVPAIVAPYPLAAGNHQERNARELGQGVRIVHDAELGPFLADELVGLLEQSGDERRAAMGAALAEALPLDGARRIWDELAALARAGR